MALWWHQVILQCSPSFEKISAHVKWETVGTLLSAAAAHMPCVMLDVLEDLDSEEPTRNSHN